MADALTRSQLIQQQIENLQRNAPPPVTEAERQQIMKGRKKQSDIDAGRAAIDARAKEVSDYTAKVDKLMGDLGSAQKDDAASAEKAKREAGSDVMKDIAGPAAAGAAGGSAVSYGLNRIVHGGAKDRANAVIEIGKEIGPTKDLTNSQVNLSRAVGAANAAERYVPSTLSGKLGQIGGKVATYGVPVGALAFEFSRYNKIANDESKPWDERQGAARMANGFLGAFSGIGVEGAARAFNSKIQPGEGEAMMRVMAARDFARRMDAKNAPPAVAPPASTSQSPLARALQGQTIDAEVVPEAAAVAPPAKALPAPTAEPAPVPPEAPPAAAEAPTTASATPGNKQWMRDQIKAINPEAKVTTRMSKSDLATALADAIAEHGGKRTVAPRSGPSGGGKAALLGPAVAAGTAYLAGSNRAEAADGSTPPPSLAETLAPPAAAAGGTYAGSKLLQALGTAGKAAGGMMEPIGGMGIDPLEGGSREDTAQKIAQSRADMSYNMPWISEKVLGIPRVEGAGYPITQSPDNLPASSPMRPEPGNQNYPLSSPVQGQNPGAVAEQPGGIPAALQSRIQRMVSLGAPPEAVAAMLNQALAQ